MATATAAKESCDTSDYSVYEEEVRRKKLETKCRHINSETELIAVILNEIANKIHSEIQRQTEELKQEEYRTEFEESILEWEDILFNITTSLHGIGNESREIEDGLSQIYHYINKKTGVFISWPHD